MELFTLHFEFVQGNLLLSMNRPEAAVIAYRGAQELRPDLRSYQGMLRQSTDLLHFHVLA